MGHARKIQRPDPRLGFLEQEKGQHQGKAKPFWETKEQGRPLRWEWRRCGFGADVLMAILAGGDGGLKGYMESGATARERRGIAI
jgi:hypothetical protein